jgi:hypothetical protein
MNAIDNKSHHAEKAVQDSTANDAPSQAAHAEVFSDPHEFMSVMKNNFAALSHGQDTLSLNDLKFDSIDQSLAPTIRAAAKVAQDHYDELLAIGDQGQGDTEKSTSLTQNALQFGLDMADGNVVAYAARSTASKTIEGGLLSVVGGGSTVAGGAMLASAVSGEIGEDELFGASVVGMTGFGGLVLGAGAIAYGAYLGYEGITSYKRYSKYSSDDQMTISKWLK